MANEYKAWRGAVEPKGQGGSGNEYKAWRGAVEPKAAMPVAQQYREQDRLIRR